VRTLVVPLNTEDGAATNGFLFSRGGESTVVCIMHPREFMATHYLIPDILDSGCAAWSQASRSVGNDLRLEHETALLDVAASVAWLRAQGFKKVVLLGNSGGASLYGFYNEQSLLNPSDRLAFTPGGRKTGLSTANMPPVDGVILVSPHPGQGKLLLSCIDPAVVDENDPLQSDPNLDFLNSRNGYNGSSEPARYSEDFVARYRDGQRLRVERLDRIARNLIKTRMDARKRTKDGGTHRDKVIGSFTPIMTVWRTDADLRTQDLTLDPSKRKRGSVWGSDPFASNYGSVGFARLCTPESWLSTWSGISSNADLERTASAIAQPSLIIGYTGDNTVFPSNVENIARAIVSSDKTVQWFDGDHHGRGLVEGEPAGRELAGKSISSWLEARFPTAR
jgi:pimeloyl-ACP methyl ester carboxylesterase